MPESPARGVERVRAPAGEPVAEPPAEPSAFVHPMEVEFARLLDFYHIAWLYEPTSFALNWAGDQVTEMFTPDFYLPDLDLYVELTTMRQRLVTRKHRKIRRLRELHPGINIRLLYRRDYLQLIAAYGYGAVEIESLREEDIARILVSRDELAARVAELGAQISLDYAGRSLVLVGVLKGITFFLADLARAITRPVAIEYLSISRPDRGAGDDPVRIVKDLDRDIAGQHVLLVEDIVNTGLTLAYLVKELRARDPASLAVCTLLDKADQRVVPVALDYAGFTIPDEFVVGYGLDYRELYRNLPFICVLRREVYAAHGEAVLAAGGEVRMTNDE
ncbi:MAG TPA: hypoxanthine phosphoribosyltransferase [Thermomicrobiales bacterium]|nr:hypoxanthine phosphoribosyltransferase [Thermomicrobiales bacterium]